MQADEFDELAGRIEAIAQAVLHLAAMLEMQNIIDGPQFSQWMRESVPEHTTSTALRHTARKTLQEMAQALDDARSSRQSSSHQ